MGMGLNNVQEPIKDRKWQGAGKLLPHGADMFRPIYLNPLIGAIFKGVGDLRSAG